MGAIVDQLQGRSVTVDTQLLYCSHSKLVEYYSAYKSICEGFTINVPQYTHIFGPNQLSFQIWDPKGKAKIDALEMFAGLIVFSSIRYEQKVKFLFELFDFNEEGTLHYENLALMLFNIQNAAYKIYTLDKNANQAEVESFLEEYFTEDSEISLEKLIRWTLRVDAIGSFFKAIGHQIDQPKEEKKICELNVLDFQMNKKPKVYANAKPVHLDPKFLAKIQSGFHAEEGKTEERLNLDVQWVYGIHLGRQSIKYLCVQGQKAANQRIIYCVGKLIVVYFPKLNAQQYYRQHKQPVSVIEISSLKNLVASGEAGQYPEIHVWDLQTKLPLLKFKKMHKDTVTLIKFIKNDRLLVSASQNVFLGGNGSTPIIIIHLETQEIIMSTYLQYEILGLTIRAQSYDKRIELLAVGKEEIAAFFQENETFDIKSERIKNQSQVLCFVVHPKGLLTCHAHRKLQLWNDQLVSQPLPYSSLSECEVMQMVCLGQEQIFLLDFYDIEVLRLEQNIISRVYLLRINQTRLLNLGLYSMQSIGTEAMLIVSEFGQIIRVDDLDHFESPRFHKYHQLFRTIEPQDYAEIDSKTIILSEHLIYSVDRYERELCQLMRYQEKLQRVECAKNSIMVLGVQQNQSIILHLNPIDVKIKETQRFKIKLQDFALTDTHLLVLSENTLLLFNRTQQKYFQKQAYTVKLPFQKNNFVVPTSNSYIFLLFNDLREIYRIVISGANQLQIQKVEKTLQATIQQFSAYYPDDNHRFPLCANLNRKLLALSQKNGDILLWNNIRQAQTEQEFPSKIQVHCGRVGRLILKKEQMISMGVQDQMVAIFKHNPYQQKDNEDQPFIQPIQESQKLRMTSKPTDLRSTIAPQKEPVFQPPRTIGGNFLKESEVEIIPLLEGDKSDLKEIIRQIVNPKDKTAYQTQLQNGTHQNATKASLTIHHTFGMSSSLSVFYLHTYPREPRSAIEPRYWQPVHHKNSSNQQDLSFASSLLLPLDDIHPNCSRRLIFASDRLCVIRERKDNSQQFYEFHRRKVTCISLHPQHLIVVSCEEGTPNPALHLWEPQQLSTKAILPTRHRASITRASFSRDGQWIVTLGGEKGGQSFEIMSWRDEESIGWVSLQGEWFKDIMFNPYNRREVSIIGTKVIKVYKYATAQLILTDDCEVDQDFCCAVYTSSVFGDRVESDLITGSSSGDMGIFICGKFIVSKEKVHSGAVLCLRLAELFGYKRVLISGGADGVVKIWDIKFNELSRKDIRSQIYSFQLDSSKKPNTAVTSLDIYQCLKNHGADRPPTLLLMGCGDGSVLQARINNEFQGYQTKSSVSNQIQQLKQKINFDVSLVFSAPPSFPGTCFQINGDIMITYNRTNQFVQIWNILSGQRTAFLYLEEPPSLLRIMNCSPIFLVGYKKDLNRSFQLFQIEIYNSTTKAINIIAQIALPKNQGEPIMAQFSEKDNRLAIAFQNPESDSICIYSKQSKGYFINGKISQTSRALFLEFSSEAEVLLVGWTESKSKDLSTFLQKQYIFKCYNPETQEELPLIRFDFKRIDFSRRIKITYLQCSHLGKVEQDLVSRYAIGITAMAHFDCFVLLGSANGEIFIVQSQFFIKKEEQKKTIRNYLVSDSAITGLQVKDSSVYVSCAMGEGILKLDIKIEEGWGIKCFPKDIYSEVITPQTLDNRLRHVYSKRRKIQAEEEIQGDSQCGISLRIAAVIGRNALYKRNNIFVTLKDEIISFSGCNILVMKSASNKKLQQLLIKPDPTPRSILSEISAIALGECKRMLVVGTREQNSKILVWNVSTNTYLYQMALNGYVSVSIIKLSSSGKHAAVVATMLTAVTHLLFLNLPNKNILAVTSLPPQVTLLDLCFPNNEEFTVLGCGQNFMGEWRYNNGILKHKRYALDNNQDLSDIRANGIIFYSIIFIGDMAITSGSDGYLYVWKEGTLAKRQNAHPGHAVLSLYTAPNSKIFASGGTNGRVVIWKIWSSLIIQHQGQYPKQGNLKFPVQSISMTRDSLVVGDTSGSIVCFPFAQEEEGRSHTLIAPFDHESINTCAFSTSSKRLYVITESQGAGTFAVFDSVSFEKIREQRIDFKSPLIKMISCRLSNKVFFILKNYVLGFVLQLEGKQDRAKILRNKWTTPKIESGIKTAAISSRENYLAILIAQSSQHNAKIQIYDLTHPEATFFAVYKVEENIASNTDLIDFCIDHDYLVYQGQQQDQTIIDLMTKEKIKSTAIEAQLEWNQQAKKISPSVADIAATYSEDNRLLRLVQVMSKCLIATDEIGSVRVFRYPLAGKGAASQVCIEHLNEVYICVISPDERTLVTVGREDRAIHFWQIVHES